jgi:hypothetical protein
VETYIKQNPSYYYANKTLKNLTKQYCIDNHIVYNPHLTKTFKKALKEVYPELICKPIKHNDEDNGLKKGEIIIDINPIYTTRFLMAYKSGNNTLLSVMDNHERVIYACVYSNLDYTTLQKIIIYHEKETGRSVYTITNNVAFCRSQNIYYVNAMLNPAMFAAEKQQTEYNLQIYIDQKGEFIAPPNNVGYNMFCQWLAWILPQIKQKNICYYLDNMDTNIYIGKTTDQVYKQYCATTNTTYNETDLIFFGRLMCKKYPRRRVRVNGVPTYIYIQKEC